VNIGPIKKEKETMALNILEKKLILSVLEREL